MALTHQEIFERYVYAGAVTRDPDAIAALFTEEGVYDAPLAPDGHPLPGRLVGRAAIRAGTSAYHQSGGGHEDDGLAGQLTRAGLSVQYGQLGQRHPPGDPDP
ncbi:SnoaL-like domain-containing protein [Micromonospora matsumotoense]|uniref:SnoaL-like domain-containing protein n=1 Tax=Micromonospora matsumotoense TaxID=121616 RepID=A0A1C4Y459_9ACTN|nr:SnoaL-like domain-containing protein [Micromonospora matsumotoense]